MNVMFLGQKNIGEKCFEMLIADDFFSIKVALSNKEYENTWWKSNNVYKLSMDNDIPFYDNKTKDNKLLLNLIDEYKISMIISVQHSFILSDEVLAKVNYNAYNLHMAKLPDYKGYHSFSHAILNKDDKYFVTIHKMAKDVDSGDIVCEYSFNIDVFDTAYSLYIKANKNSLGMFKEFLYKSKEKK